MDLQNVWVEFNPDGQPCDVSESEELARFVLPDGNTFAEYTPAAKLAAAEAKYTHLHGVFKAEMNIHREKCKAHRKSLDEAEAEIARLRANQRRPSLRELAAERGVELKERQRNPELDVMTAGPYEEDILESIARAERKRDRQAQLEAEIIKASTGIDL